MKRLVLGLAAALAFAMPAAAHNHPDDDAVHAALAALTPELSAAIDASLAGAQRTDEDRARDVFRHPKETLAFWGVKPEMTIVEIAPGQGYWTEIIAPVMKEPGVLVLATINPDNPVGKGLADLTARLSSDPAFARVRLTIHAPAKGLPIMAPGSTDMVILSRITHQLIRLKIAEAAFKIYFDALKSGGVLAIEQHRWPEELAGYGEAGVNPSSKISGYVKESEIVAIATAAGFRLDARSEINSNPKDTHVHPFGVWTLPPSLFNTADGKKDGEAFDSAPYVAIGESDRITLRFVKP